MKKNTKGRAAAILVMLLLIVISVPVGMHTTMAQKDNRAMRAFYQAAAGSSVHEILTADDSLGENLVRNARIIVEDFKDSTEQAELSSAQIALESTYRDFSRQIVKKSHNRAQADRLVETYNAFGSAMFHWFSVADGVLEGKEDKYQTYSTFREKFIQNHVLLEDSEYNEEAETYNELFDRLMVRVLRPVAFVQPLERFAAEDF